MTEEDLACLDPGEFLNDVIIDFYLKSVGVCPAVAGINQQGSLTLLLLQVSAPGGSQRDSGPEESRLQQLLLQAAEPATGGRGELRPLCPVRRHRFLATRR